MRCIVYRNIQRMIYVTSKINKKHMFFDNYATTYPKYILKMYKKQCEMKRTQKVRILNVQKSPRVFDPLCTTSCFAHSSHPQAISSNRLMMHQVRRMNAKCLKGHHKVACCCFGS